MQKIYEKLTKKKMYVYTYIYKVNIHVTTLVGFATT